MLQEIHVHELLSAAAAVVAVAMVATVGGRVVVPVLTFAMPVLVITGPIAATVLSLVRLLPGSIAAGVLSPTIPLPLRVSLRAVPIAAVVAAMLPGGARSRARPGPLFRLAVTAAALAPAVVRPVVAAVVPRTVLALVPPRVLAATASAGAVVTGSGGGSRGCCGSCLRRGNNGGRSSLLVTGLRLVVLRSSGGGRPASHRIVAFKAEVPRPAAPSARAAQALACCAEFRQLHQALALFQEFLLPQLLPRLLRGLRGRARGRVGVIFDYVLPNAVRVQRAAGHHTVVRGHAHAPRRGRHFGEGW